MIVRRCAGHYADGSRCSYGAKRASRYCTIHRAQRPDAPVRWLVEGRTRRAPELLLHLLAVGEVEPWGAVPDSVLCSRRPAGKRDEHAPPSARVCPRCRGLALDAVAAGEVEPDHLRRWELGEPNIDERCAVWLGHDDDEGGSNRCAGPTGHRGSHDARSAVWT